VVAARSHQPKTGDAGVLDLLSQIAQHDGAQFALRRQERASRVEEVRDRAGTDARRNVAENEIETGAFGDVAIAERRANFDVVQFQRPRVVRRGADGEQIAVHEQCTRGR